MDDDVGRPTHDGSRRGRFADAVEMPAVDDVSRTAGPTPGRHVDQMDPAATLIFAITMLLTLDVLAVRLVGGPTHPVSRR
jgi:hypothetical protein